MIEKTGHQTNLFRSERITDNVLDIFFQRSEEIMLGGIRKNFGTSLFSISDLFTFCQRPIKSEVLEHQFMAT